MKWLVSGKLTSKGQITLPKLIREKLNVSEGDLISFGEDKSGRLYLEKVKQGQTCTICQNGHVALNSTQQAEPCPICNETRIIQANSEEEWLKLGIDCACRFNITISITQQNGFYQLHYKDYKTHLDKSLIDNCHDLVQLGLIREKFKQFPPSKYLVKERATQLTEFLFDMLYTANGKQLLKKLIKHTNSQEQERKSL